MRAPLALIEIHGLAPALVALDALDKAARVRLIQMELNDLYGVLLKISGDSGAVRAAVAAARQIVASMRGQIVATVLDSPNDEAWRAIDSRHEVSPLLEAPVVFFPNESLAASRGSSEEQAMNQSQPFAIGLIETQGFTAVMEAIDTACKAAAVEVIGKEKLGGGYVTVLIKGDVAAVKAAIEAGKSKVDGLGKLIAAHVIARPSPAVLGLLPK
jgi:microcompartment protein CcmL/EutN